ncbi:RagB/SusD family nutrient uptake outer membrane protein [Pedobacter sp. N36a]|uniref:RagB/SusD family nutrient uptake outer membrane protein n=1 Tax=Pedobacter sp. N36a TaxID=2767996 RepID=UPI001656F9D6|nr:RagB/SusD family nutrient uptake outer membrane protein [Pedobacter sp. N36a]MBC8986182.1 RagB/SusD family nutrient uptake outer membrane protein [Pedobacter sp. N36a]
MNKYLLIILSLLTFGCSKIKVEPSPDPTPQKKHQVTGFVEKGPFLQGSKVTLIELDNNLAPTGKTYETTTTNDMGAFEFKDIVLSSAYAKFSIDGFYFDEVRNTLSTSRIILTSIAKIGEIAKVNVNLLTHLESNRIVKLVKTDKLDFAAAKKQATTELLAGLDIKQNLTKETDELSLTDGTKDAAVLMAISAVMLNNPIHTDASLSEFLSKISTQLENTGTLDESIKTTFKSYASRIDPERIKANLIARYKTLGKEVNVLDDLKSIIGAIEVPDIVIVPELSDTEIITFETAVLNRYALFIEKYDIYDALYAPNKVHTSLSSSFTQFYNHSVSLQNLEVYNLWAQAYQTLAAVNEVMKKTKNPSSAKINELRKSMVILRAHVYYLLTDTWGNVPVPKFDIILEPLAKPQAKEETRTQNIAELNTLLASENLSTPLNNPLGNMTALGYGLLGKYEMLTGQYASAKQHLAKLENAGFFKLALPGNKFVNSADNETLAGYGTNLGPAFASPAFVAIAKKGTYPSIMRATEVVLLQAEAEMQLGNLTAAASYLNKVRVRNGKSAIAQNTKEELIKFLLEEYKEDLGMEGVYFSALKRLGKAETVLGIPAYKTLLPFPFDELKYNYLIVQNPGY